MTTAHSPTVTCSNGLVSVASSNEEPPATSAGPLLNRGGNGPCRVPTALPSAHTPWGACRSTARRGQALGLILLLGTLVLSGCSLQRFAANRLGDALAGGASVYATDDDPDLVAAAMPFGLKTIESLLMESPHHKGLLLSATSGFTQYAYAFVQTEADIVEDTDLKRATALREQAGRLYRRALGYGLRGLEEVRPNLLQALRSDPQTALARFRKADVPQLYWTAAAWGAAIALNKTDSELGADLPLVEALMHRALELDEGFGLGAIYDFYIVYEGGRPAAAGGSVERARASLARALQLSEDHRAAPLVSFAETVDVGLQDRTEFETLLNQALAIDVNALPEQRLANLIAQRRARWLLARMDRLFLE
jgi:predicted anti-sigma-YlaC factor YlaD